MTAFDRGCTRCPRLVALRRSVAALYPDYHNAPVAPCGPVSADLLIVGLAPGRHGANATGRPFTGDHAGVLLYETLFRHGFASSPVSAQRGDGLRLRNCRITNAVKCLPPANKPIGAEVNRCNDYLAAELSQARVIIALGGVAHRAVVKASGRRQSELNFAHAAEHALARNCILLDSYHCSRYNTQTKRLTPAMFDAVFARACALIAA